MTFQRVGPARAARAAQPVVPLEQRRTRSSASRSKTRSPSRCCGASPSPPRAAAACSWTPPTSSLRDVHNAAGRLRPGNYRVDRTRSAFYLPRTKGFPKNTEIEMTLTFVNEAGGGGRGGGGGPAQGPAPIGAAGGGRRRRRGGGLFSGSVASVTPTPDAVTMREHVSLVELPDAQLQAAHATIRAPATAASPSSTTAADRRADGQFRYIRRHRLEKKDPTAAVSEPVKPIQYWVDSGAPEDVKKALVEGARLVEPGVRGRRLPQRVQGGCAARRRRPDGHPLQHDQLGPSLDARLELRRLGDRSAHRRDHQGHGHARLAARSAGLHDLRRPALAVHERQRAAGDPLRNGAQAHPPARPRTRSATRSASATTTTTAARAGSR